MNDEIALTILSDLEENEDLLDIEKADFLRGFSTLYEKVLSKDINDRIDELWGEWD